MIGWAALKLMVKIKRIQNFEDISEKTWNEVLETSSENYIFQTYEFTRTWWKYFGENRKNRELLLLLAEDGGSPVAIAPLMIKRLPFIKGAIIQFIGTDICDYMDFIINTKNYRRYLSAITGYLSTLPFLEVDLRFIPGDSETLRKPDAINEKGAIWGEIRQIDACPYINLENDWQGIIGAVRKKLTGEVRRNERKLREKGNLVFKTPDQETQIKVILKNYFNLHVKKWKHYGGKYSQFQYKHWRDFVTGLSRSISDKGWLDISYLELDGNMAACHFGFIYNGRLCYYMPTFDPDLAAYSPSKILLMKMLERSYKNGLREFDFLRGKEPYKLAWTKTTRPLYNLCYYSKGLPLRYSGFIYRNLCDGFSKKVKPLLKKVNPLIRAWYGSRGDT